MVSERVIDSRAEHGRADSRRRVLQVVRASAGGCSIQQIAQRTGLHPNTVRFHLDHLENERLVSGQIQRGPRPGRPPLTYTANPVPDAEGMHRDFASLAGVLVQLVGRTNADPAAAAIQQGRFWDLIRAEDVADSADTADTAAVIGGLVKALTKAGFATEVSMQDDDEHAVILHRHCPFLELAQAHQDIVCSLHLGLMRGVLERLDTPVAVERLVPFASPAGCEAHLACGDTGSRDG